jgi:16S rRNA (guanine527-N7)-methyltransferase
VNLISRKDFEHSVRAAHPAFAWHRQGGAVQEGHAHRGRGHRRRLPIASRWPSSSPASSFHGIDGIGKKIAAVQGVIESLGLRNATAEQVRSEHHKARYDFIVSRAVSALPEFITATRHLVPRSGQVLGKQGGPLRSGLLYLKGGELADELRPLRHSIRVTELRDVFHEEFFATKKVVEVAL